MKTLSIIQEKIKSIDKKYFNKLPKIKRIILQIKPVSYYIEISERYYNQRNIKKTEHILSKALKYYTNNYYLNEKMAIFEMNHGTMEQAYKHWEKVIKLHPKVATAEDYYMAASVLANIKESKKSLEVLEKGLVYYPKSTTLLKEISSEYVQQKKWTKAKKSLISLFNINSYIPTVQNYTHLATAYYEKNNIHKAEYIMQEGLKFYNFDFNHINHCIDLYIKMKKWDQATILIKSILNKFPKEISNEQKNYMRWYFKLMVNLLSQNYYMKKFLIISNIMLLKSHVIKNWRFLITKKLVLISIKVIE